MHSTAAPPAVWPRHVGRRKCLGRRKLHRDPWTRSQNKQTLPLRRRGRGAAQATHNCREGCGEGRCWGLGRVGDVWLTGVADRVVRSPLAVWVT
eukprot:351800-Chlamydomonas_euryale.AAC.3